ncbi:PREDICTED: uncharacterized protein LOC104592654 [Nelumbo nucifera]|uniref:Uncharacterized protein LOC104592654 n=1 Tax=Nelumbo nucifera TaxID=4432 RepID=A0A1U7ZA64_NELNU|nr:PREDICTED: uncharacterized protein LOC104592654 [Nelumbo nucifera]
MDRWWNNLCKPVGIYKDYFIREKFARVSWFIWKNRNSKCFNGHTYDAKTIINRALAYWNEIKEISSCVINNNRKMVTHVEWFWPKHNYIKINFDASCSNSGNYAIGCIARNHQGNVLESKAIGIRSSTINLVEAWATINMAINYRDQKIIIEGDSKLVIDCLNGRLAPP